MLIAIVAVYFVLSRLAYVGGVGYALRRQDRDAVFTRYSGVEAGFARFRRMASIIMNNDGVSFVVLCLVTYDMLHGWIASWPMRVFGVVLCLVGIGVKVWAARILGSRAYYWYNFFGPGDVFVADRGPYRYVSDPMYTVGYLHTWGFALVMASWPGLVAAALAQASILVFNRVVEQPHFEKTVATRV